ncbi:hypothetical protein Acry_2491 [Acidiphilium cryptum JF-5]|uniref:Uncharacterized protein n=1 Tax=Acidiphilium cryptum (strain JF-5) TaxID=349163 RepID=A5G1F1_ACICJ|nr:hypothetical protein Acry_2491 [Acidiphilium cryptum JF-5]
MLDHPVERRGDLGPPVASARRGRPRRMGGDARQRRFEPLDRLNFGFLLRHAMLIADFALQ